MYSSCCYEIFSIKTTFFVSIFDLKSDLNLKISRPQFLKIFETAPHFDVTSNTMTEQCFKKTLYLQLISDQWELGYIVAFLWLLVEVQLTPRHESRSFQRCARTTLKFRSVLKRNETSFDFFYVFNRGAATVLRLDSLHLLKTFQCEIQIQIRFSCLWAYVLQFYIMVATTHGLHTVSLSLF